MRVDLMNHLIKIGLANFSYHKLSKIVCKKIAWNTQIETSPKTAH